jgi:hypothetical protein
MPSRCVWCSDLGVPEHRISRTAIGRHKRAWEARQLGGAGDYGDSGDGSNSASDVTVNREEADNVDIMEYEPSAIDSVDSSDPIDDDEPRKLTLC